METNNLSSNIEVGRLIFESIPTEIVPFWAGLVLSRFDKYIKNIPVEISEIYVIIENEDKWQQAHNQFTKIRRFLLDNKKYRPQSYLLLAELVAKVTYNSAMPLGPFDKDSGWYIASLASQTAHFFNDSKLEEDVKSAILIFYHNKNLLDNLNAAKDFLIYKKFDASL